ncbi:hypothetical protein [Niabella sp.]|uniref:hypothetical protein n=1 Tax=Niabella sp. TaxID=1962976 RepID=UPI0026346647|nr:hypothetical protein [Niabella sp.]
MTDFIQAFKTITQCDLALAAAAKKQKALQKKQRNTKEATEQFQETVSGILQEMTGREKDIADYKQRLATDLNQKERDEIQDKLVRAEYALYQLQRRERNYGIAELAGKDFDLGELDRGAESLAEFIAAVEARKAAL